MRFPRLVPRRNFLLGLAAWGGAGAILPGRLAQGKESVPEDGLPPAPLGGITTVLSAPGARLDRTNAAIFEEHLGSAFRIVPGSGALPRLVHLTRVTRLQTIAQTNPTAFEPTPAFSLIFRGPAGPALVQGTYQVEHPQIGVFPLFLVPIGPNRAEACYEAIFA